MEGLFQRDYILRMIEMMGDLARRVAQLMEELDYLHQLDDASRQHCGLPLKALEELSHESLIELLGPEPRLYASELLYLRAVEPSAQWDVRDRMLLKSLRLLVSLKGESLLCEVRAPRLAEVKETVLPLMTGYDLFVCALFFEQAQRFDQMEDALFQAAATGQTEDGAEDWPRLGAQMLRKAAAAKEEALALCGMTAEELLEAAVELETMAEETEE